MRIAHRVKCRICGDFFDRDTSTFVLLKERQYAHADCYLRDCASREIKPILTIIDPTDEVECKYCHKKFFKSKTPHILIGKKQYAHQSCAELEQQRERTPEERLNEYICQIYGSDFVHPRIQKQIKQFMEDYNFTTSGIFSTLKYILEVKHINIKEYDSIGLVPYLYNEAKQYYYEIWKAQNQDNVEYKIEIEEITIPIPQKNPIRSKLFSFLDKDNI